MIHFHIQATLQKRDHEHWMQIEPFHIGNEITDQSTRFSDDITN